MLLELAEVPLVPPALVYDDCVSESVELVSAVSTAVTAELLPLFVAVVATVDAAAPTVSWAASLAFSATLTL